MSREYALSQSQSLIWLGTQLAPDVPLYESIFTFDTVGEIEPAAFCRAFDQLVHQNDAMRLQIVERSTGVVGRFSEGDMPTTQYLDFTEQAESIESWIASRMGGRLDPHACMFDSVLIKKAEGQFCWYLNMHHLITDGATVSLILKKQEALYQAELDSKLPPLPNASPASYAHFLSLEPEQRQNPLTPKQKSWWRERSGRYEPSRLYNRIPVAADWRQKRYTRQLGEQRSEKVRKLASSTGFRALSKELSLFNVFATALACFIHRVESRNNLRFGVTTNGRKTTLDRETVGLFMQILPFQLDIDPSFSFREVAKLVAAENIGLLQNAHPSAATPEAMASFDIGLNFIPASLDSFAGGSCKATWRHTGYGDKGRKMSVTVEQFQGNDFELLFDFACAAVSQEGRDAAIKHYLAIVDCMLDDPDSAIGKARFLSDDETQRTSKTLQPTIHATPERLGSSLWSQFEEVAAQSPSTIAIHCDGFSIDYSTLHREAKELSEDLIRRGCKPGQIVPVLGDRCPAYVRAILAVLAAEAAFLPIDVSNPAARVESILDDSRCDWFLRCSEDKVCFDNVRQRKLTDPQQVHQPDAAYVMYTSGSTGKPKGVVVGHDSVTLLLADIEHKSKLGEANIRCSWWTNIGFDVSIYEVFTSLLYGRCLCIPDQETRVNPTRLFEWLDDQQITAAYLPPFFVQAFATHIEKSRSKALQRLLVGVEPIPEYLLSSLLQRCPQLTILNGYGPTESTVCATVAKLLPSANSEAPAPIGGPILGTKCYVLSAAGVPVPQGVVGELFLGGAGLAMGYLHKQELTDQHFIEDPTGETDDIYYRTGDLVRLRFDNQLEYVGRVDGQLKIHGIRIDPGEIQQAVTSVAGIDQCFATTLGGTHSGRLLAAFYTVQPNAPAPSEHDLREACLNRLPRNMVPTRFIRLCSFPRTTNGKIDYEAIRESALSQELHQKIATTTSEPQSPLQKKLHDIWCKVLGRDSIGLDDDLFSLGGDSMSVVQIVSLANQMGLEIKSSKVFQHPTIRQLEAQVVSIEDGSSVLMDVVEQPVLTPIQRWFFHQPFVNRNHWNHVLTLPLQPGVDVEVLESTLQHVFQRHEAFQLRYKCVDNDWRPERKPKTAAQAGCIFRHANQTELHSSISIETGRLWAASIGDEERVETLTLVAHHLAVDAASWSTLLQEIEHTYNYFRRTGAFVPSSRSPSPSAWAEHQHQFIASPDGESHHRYWERQLSRETRSCITNSPSSPRATHSSEMMRSFLTPEQSDLIAALFERESRFNIQELLLTALADAISRDTRTKNTYRIDLEGHGRQPIDGGAGQTVDPAAVIGWLTSVYPFIFDHSSEDDALTRVLNVGRQLREIPQGGWSYGAIYFQPDRIQKSISSQAEVLFNFLGSSAITSENSLWKSVSKLELSCAPDEHTPYAIELNAFQHNNLLEFQWKFCSRRVPAQQARELSQSFLLHLTTLLKELTEPSSVVGHSAADFPLAKLDGRKLGQLAKVLNKAAHEQGRSRR